MTNFKQNAGSSPERVLFSVSELKTFYTETFRSEFLMFIYNIPYVIPNIFPEL